MRSVKLSIQLSIGAALLAFIISLFSLSWLNWINNYFYIGLLLLNIGFIRIIYEGGFFTIFARSMRKMMKSMSKKQQYLDSLEENKDEENYTVVRASWKFAFVYSGVFIFILTFALSLLIL